MTFDVVVIGGGPGGYKAALTAARLGARVALVERGAPGGTCLNQGCVPKKALLHLASLIEDIRGLQGRGLSGDIAPDLIAAFAHKDSVVDGIRANFSVWLKRLGVTVISGQAALAGRAADQYRIAVRADEECELRAPRVILATGAQPRALATCPFDGERVLHSGHFMTQPRERAASMLIVGGGAIGTEFAFLMHQFGTRVTLVEATERLLPKPCIPERASAALERKFARLGIDVHKRTEVLEACRVGDGVRVRLGDGHVATYERVLVAIGRTPMTADVGLTAVDIALDEHGFVAVNEFLETTAAGIYAVGDVKEGPMTANAALHDAKVAGANAVKGNHARPNYHQVPIVIDSALEIAAVGLTEERADAAGFTPEAARISFGASAKARARNDYEGFIEVVHDEETGQLLGGCIVGPEAGEQIHMMAAACQSDRGLWFFSDMSYSHPSWTEELENAIDPYTTALTRSGKDLFRPGIYSQPRDRA